MGKAYDMQSVINTNINLIQIILDQKNSEHKLRMDDTPPR
jgi:hypothetical protein